MTPCHLSLQSFSRYHRLTLHVHVARVSALAAAGLRKTGAATAPEVAAAEQTSGPPAAFAAKDGNAKKRKSVRFNIPTKGVRSTLTPAPLILQQPLTQELLVDGCSYCDPC